MSGRPVGIATCRPVIMVSASGWIAGFRPSNRRKAAHEFKQRRVDLGRPFLLKPVAGILHHPDEAKIGTLLAHQLDHIDAGYHAQHRLEAAGQKAVGCGNGLPSYAASCSKSRSELR